MRKEPSKINKRIVIGLARTLFILLISIGWSSAFAQQAGSTDPRDPINQYCEKHKGESHVKLYLSNPNDADAYRAVKYGMLLDNPRQYQVTESEIPALEQNFNAAKAVCESVDQKMKSGMSYDQARTNHDNEMIMKERLNRATMGGNVPEQRTAQPGKGDQETPSISAPNN